jgi:hypothetical protein
VTGLKQLDYPKCLLIDTKVHKSKHDRFDKVGLSLLAECAINGFMDIKFDRDKLTKAFGQMAENINQAIHNTEELLAPTIDEMVHNSKSMAEDIHQLSQEEAAFLSEALKLELENASQSLSEQKTELKDWLGFDLLLVEQKFLELLERSADKSWLELMAFEEETSRTKEVDELKDS